MSIHIFQLAVNLEILCVKIFFEEIWMRKYKIGREMRFFFLFSATLILFGIWLTGFSTVHWLLYIPTVFFYFAAITGICPGLLISRFLFGVSESSVKSDSINNA